MKSVIIVIQLQAIKHKGDLGLIFTSVLDLITPDEEDETSEPTDRAYWVKRATKETVEIADQLLIYINEFAPGFSLNYTKNYIGLAQNDIVKNFVGFDPKKSITIVSAKLIKSEEVDEIINNSDLDQLAYSNKGKRYRFRLKQADLISNKDTIIDLMKIAYEEYTGTKVSGDYKEE